MGIRNYLTTIKTSRKKMWLIIAGVVLIMAMCCGIMNALGISGSNIASPPAQVTQPTNTAAPTAQPTNTPIPAAKPTNTPAPTAKPTNTSVPVAKTSAVTHGTPRIGGPVSDFVGKYGQPDTNCATCARGIYNFQRVQGTQTDYISTMLTDANGHVSSFLVQAPLNSDWDSSTANAICESFGPSDVNYDRPVQVFRSSDGTIIERVYKSAWLAGQLAVGDFQDNNTMSGNTNLPPGTFNIDYSYPSEPSHVSDCSLDAGIDRVV